MIIKPSFSELLGKGNGKYSLVIGTAKRARQIADGSPKLTNAKIMCSADKIIDGELHINGNKIEHIGKSKEFEADRVIDCKNN